MSSRSILLTFLAVLATLTLAITAQAASGPGPDGPELATIAIGPADFKSGGATAEGEYLNSKEYEQTNKAGVLGSARVMETYSEVSLMSDDAEATSVYKESRRALSSRAGKKAFQRQLARGFEIKLERVKVTKVAPLAIAGHAFELRAQIRLKSYTLQTVMVFVQRDRALTVVAMISHPNGKLPPSTGKTAATLVSAHVLTAFQITNVTLPLITGTAQAGQTLTASPGRWGGGPTKLVYQWSRCDAAGANCVSIPGAIQRTYLVGTADVGFTLRATVTASNGLSSLPAPSAQTAPAT